MAGEIEFDWDDGNTTHLAAHGVTPAEVEQAMNNDPLDLDLCGDRRRRAVPLGRPHEWRRFLLVVWTVRRGKLRAVTAFPASVSNKKAFLERSR